MKAIYIYLFILFSVLFFNHKVFAQTDTSKRIRIQNKWYASKTVKTIAAPVVLMGYGVSVLNYNGLFISSRSFHTDLQKSFPGFHSSFDDEMVFTPAALALGLKLGGVPTKSNIPEGFIHYAFSLALSAGLATGLKYATHERRPDLSDYLSFPSEHTTLAFAGAEFLHQEFIDNSPWYSVAGYVLATSTGALRMLNDKHWLSDVAFGAGLGIISTRIIYLAYPLVKNRIQKHKVPVH